MAEKRFYGDEEAEQILKLAARKEHSRGSMSRDQLLAAASELGISPETLEEAELEYREKGQLEEDQREYDREQRAGFLGHFVTYLLVNGVLMFFDFRKDGSLSWAFWPLAMWGIGLFWHGLETFGRVGEDYKKNLDKWRRRKRRRERTLDLDTDLLLEEISSELDVKAQKILAIKALRERSGLDLRDAKDAVEEYLEQK